jgi:hypothetical protein
MAVVDIIFDLAPELETADSDALDRIDRFIAYAQSELNADVWAAAEEDAEVTEGDWYDMATALLAAHKLTLRGMGGSAPAGPVVSEKAGGVSTTYANPTSVGTSLTSYDTTNYGRQYLEFRRSCLPMAVAISGEELDGLADTDVDLLD